MEVDSQNQNENSHLKSAVPVLLRGEIILPELRLQKIRFQVCLNSQNSCLKSLTHSEPVVGNIAVED